MAIINAWKPEGSLILRITSWTLVNEINTINSEKKYTKNH